MLLSYFIFENAIWYWVTGTALFLTAFAIAVYFRVLIDLANFRANLKPGQYAKVKTFAGMLRCKYHSKSTTGEFVFLEVDTLRPVITIPENIYKP